MTKKAAHMPEQLELPDLSAQVITGIQLPALGNELNTATTMMTDTEEGSGLRMGG